jgi:hypothetical protein
MIFLYLNLAAIASLHANSLIAQRRKVREETEALKV